MYCGMGLVGLALMYYGTSFRGPNFIGLMLTYYGTKPHRARPYLLWNGYALQNTCMIGKPINASILL
jgi:hypothetical protein